MVAEIYPGTLKTGILTNAHGSSSTGWTRDRMANNALRLFPQNLLDMRVWDALGSLLPTAGASDDLGLITGTFNTNPPQIQTGDLKTVVGPTTRRARQIITLPDLYRDGGGVQIRCVAGMKTTVADGSATIDVEAYQLLNDGTLSADLCSTAAVSINSLTYASKVFTIDPTTLVAGDRLDVRISIAVSDTASGTAVIALLHNLILACDTQP